MTEMIIEKRDTDSIITESGKGRLVGEKSSIFQVFVFHGEDYLGWNCFNKEKISVGKNDNADLVLDDTSIADFQAVFHIQDDQIVVVNKGPQGGLCVNGEARGTFILGPLDYVSIGAYTLKLKIKKMTSRVPEANPSTRNTQADEADNIDCIPDANHHLEARAKDDASDPVPLREDIDAKEGPTEDSLKCERCKLVFEGEIIEGYEIDDVKKNLAEILRADTDQIEQLFSGQRVIVKKDVEHTTAIGYKRAFEKAGAVCAIEKIQRNTIAEEGSSTGKNVSSKAGEVTDVDPDEEFRRIEESEDPPISFEKEETENEYAERNTTNTQYYRIVFEGERVDSYEVEEVKANLVALFQFDQRNVEQFFSGKRIVIKKDTDFETARKYQQLFEKAGAVCTIEEISVDGNTVIGSARETDSVSKADEISGVEFVKDETETPNVVSENVPTEDDSIACRNKAGMGEQDPSVTEQVEEETTNNDVETSAAETSEKKDSPLHSMPMLSAAYYEDEEEEEDYEDEDLLHFLKEEFVDSQKALPIDTAGGTAIEIVKFREENVIDVTFLNQKEKYYCSHEDGQFCLAENKDPDNCYFYFNNTIEGRVCGDGAAAGDISGLCTQDKLYRKKKKIYRDSLPKDGHVSISDGYYDYVIRKVVRNKSPHIPEPPKEKKHVYNNLMKSAGFHVMLVIFMALFISLPDPPGPPPPESRFVQIDTNELMKMKPPVPKPVPKPKVKKPPKIKPVQRPTPKKTVKKGKTGKRSVVARSPKAGGGSGKDGNVLNRNVNQAGILGMIGDSIGFKPKEALAVVTNLDAVSSSHSSEGNFKVGGIVGKLDSSKISIPSAGIVGTQGSTQVLRSAGIKGKGTVAALEKGKTGEGTVMAMVSAKLDKKVRIRGGMSREAVKKVIDQHLDEITYCYESALVANPSIMGKVVFEWKILMSGRVGEVRIKTSSINSSEIHSCIKESIKTWQFPKPRGQEVVVSYPFIFDIVGF